MNNEIVKSETFSPNFQIVDLTKYENGKRKINYATGEPFNDDSIFKYTKSFQEGDKWIKKQFIKIFQMCSVSELIKLTHAKFIQIEKLEEKLEEERKEVLRYIKYLGIPNTSKECLNEQQINSEFGESLSKLQGKEETVSLIKDEYTKEEVSRALQYWIANASKEDVITSLEPVFASYGCSITKTKVARKAKVA